MPPKIIGQYGLTLQQGYPRLSGNNGVESITVQFKVKREDYDGMLSYGTAWEPPEGADFIPANDFMRLNQRSVEPAATLANLLVTYVYTGENALANENDIIYDEVELDTQDNQIPLAKLSNYRTHWNHRLISKDQQAEVPEFFKTEKNTKIPEGFRDDYKWIKPGDQVPEGWYELAPETKPSVESKLDGVTYVTRIRRALSKSAFQRDMRFDYTPQNPPDTFDKPGEWLRGGSKLRKDGSYWTLITPYLRFEKIDADLYPPKS